VSIRKKSIAGTIAGFLKVFLRKKPESLESESADADY
jgi:hypothetical protein